MDTERAALSKEAFIEMVTELLQKGGTLQSFSGLDDNALEAIYSLAYNLYTNGQYEKSEKMFQFLSLQDHLERKYFMGLGACRQMKQKYTEAINAYSYAALLDMQDPLPPLHCGECHLALRNKAEAISGFKAALTRTENDTSLKEVYQRASSLLTLAEASGGVPCR